MNLLAVLFAAIALAVVYMSFCGNDENFQLDHYLRPNYQSGVGMLRGDLPIQPVQQSWFNTRYGPSSLAPGFFNMHLPPL